MKALRSLTALATVLLLAAACGGGGATTVHDIKPGDCLNDQPGEEILTVDLIDCADPHDLEAFHVGNIGIAGAYPGEQALEEAGRDICEGSLFDTYVGRPYLESELYAAFYLPTAESWDAGDRDIICLIIGYDEVTGEEITLTGSMRGSGR